MNLNDGRGVQSHFPNTSYRTKFLLAGVGGIWMAALLGIAWLLLAARIPQAPVVTVQEAPQEVRVINWMEAAPGNPAVPHQPSAGVTVQNRRVTINGVTLMPGAIYVGSGGVLNHYGP